MQNSNNPNRLKNDYKVYFINDYNGTKSVDFRSDIAILIFPNDSFSNIKKLELAPYKRFYIADVVLFI